MHTRIATFTHIRTHTYKHTCMRVHFHTHTQCYHVCDTCASCMRAGAMCKAPQPSLWQSTVREGLREAKQLGARTFGRTRSLPTYLISLCALPTLSTSQTCHIRPTFPSCSATHVSAHLGKLTSYRPYWSRSVSPQVDGPHRRRERRRVNSRKFAVPLRRRSCLQSHSGLVSDGCDRGPGSPVHWFRSGKPQPEENYLTSASSDGPRPEITRRLRLPFRAGSRSVTHACGPSR